MRFIDRLNVYTNYTYNNIDFNDIEQGLLKDRMN